MNLKSSNLKLNTPMIVSVAVRVVVCALLLSAALWMFVVLVQTAPRPKPSPTAGAAPRVTVMAARPVPIHRRWEGFGTAQAVNSVNVPARVTATVIAKPPEVEPGESVAAGRLLLQLDNSDFTRQVEIAAQTIADLRAQLSRLDVEKKSLAQRLKLTEDDVRLAKAEFDRVQSAYEQDAARQRELDRAKQAMIVAENTQLMAREESDKIAPRRMSLEALLAAQESTHRQAQDNVERCQIASPIDGVLQSVDVEIGENVTSGQRVARVVSLRNIEVPLLLPASARPHISTGDEVTLTSSGGDTMKWAAHVTRMAPEDDATTRTMRIYVELEQNPTSPTRLSPGKFVRGEVMASESNESWVVPRRALNSERIMLVTNGKVTGTSIDVDYHIEQPISELGLDDEQWVVLKTPLPEGTLVIVDGSRTLAEGMAVEPVIAATQRSAEMSEVNPEGGDT